MQVTPRTRLGPYEVIAPIGAGGMGEVFKARDTRLERSVAIKVLPAELSQNAQLQMRFEREAKAISQLSHPNICTLYDVGDGYLVMELLDGETLADRLKKGPLPLDQVIRIGTQIANALDCAHKAGIVHRDLKPSNVMLTKSGAKLLDFGLAAVESSVLGPQSSVLATMQKPLTEEGTLVGTFQYMAPEQLEGGTVDARTDLFAFGAVLYEMVTGKHAFEGRSRASLIASIMASEPPAITTLLPASPAALDRLIRTCLNKDPDERWQSAHDVAIELRSITDSSHGVSTRPRRGERIGWIAAVVALLVACAFLAWNKFEKPEPDSRVIRFDVPMPPKNLVRSVYPTVSPDGKYIAFGTLMPGLSSALWIRPIDSSTPRQLPDTDGAIFPFWSPDSRWIGFFANGKLKKISIDGGAPESICDAATNSRGGTWNRDGVILLSGSGGGIERVSANGGTPVPVTKLDPARQEANHRYPYFLPDGRHFLYLARNLIPDYQGIYVSSLAGGAAKRISHALSNAAYANGYLLYGDNGTLRAQHFDLERLELTGSPVTIAEGVTFAPSVGFTSMGMSNTGILAYRSGVTGQPQLTWIDQAGHRAGTLGEGTTPAISHDGTKVASEHLDKDLASTDIWILDLDRNINTRVTTDPRWDQQPVWSPDDRYVAYKRGRDIFRKPVAGGSEERIAQSPTSATLTDWTPDGRYLVLNGFDPVTKDDVYVAPLNPPGPVRKIIGSNFSEAHARVSPDGRWIAFTSDETGAMEVYVQRFDPSGAPQQKIQISRGGGTIPHWTRDGRSVIYQESLQFSKVDLTFQPNLTAWEPKKLFEQTYYGFFDVASDGKLLVAEAPGIPNEPISVVVNWPALLKP